MAGLSRFSRIALRLTALVLLAPLVVLAFSWTDLNSDTWEHLLEFSLPEQVFNSILLGLLTTTFSLSAGIYCARVVAFYRFPFSGVFRYVLVFPLSIPTYIAALTYSDFLSVSGAPQSLLRELTGMEYGEYYFPGLNNAVEISLLFSFVLYPYSYLLCLTAFEKHTASAIAVARSMGYSVSRSFYTLVLPMSKPFILVGAALITMETLAEYGAVNFLGFPVLTTGIIRVWHGFGDLGTSMQISFLLALVILPLFIFAGPLGEKGRFVNHSAGKTYEKIPLTGFKAFGAVALCGSIFSLGFVIPFIKLLNWFVKEFADIDWINVAEIALNSFMLGSLAGLVSMVLAVLLAFGLRKGKKKDKRIISVCGYGYAIPGTVISVGVLVVVGGFDDMTTYIMTEAGFPNFDFWLSGTLALPLFAYVIRFLRAGLDSVSSEFDRISENIDNASVSLGVRGRKMMMRIHLPLIAGGIFTGFFIVFIETIKELPATLFLRPYNFDTLAVYGYEQALEEVYTKAAAPLLLTAFLGMIGVILLIGRNK